MKGLFGFIIFILSCSATYSQTISSNFVIDYSQAIICGMDEDTFSGIEEDWYEDKPEINSKLLNGLLEKLSGIVVFKKSSKNTVQVKIKTITENGGFNCDISYIDSTGYVVTEIKDIVCPKGGTWGSKLNLIKDGAEKEGALLGRALKKTLKRKK